MSVVTTEIQILDSSLSLITKVQTPYKLDGSGAILRYSKELDEAGQCKFRVSSYDTLLKTYGDILVPHKNWVRIVRGGATVWQGAIIDNSRRTKDFIECTCVEPLWYLSKILIQRTSPDPTGGGAAGVYRIFSSGTMAAAVTAIMNETITTFRANDQGHPLTSLTLGTVENPNYPPNTTNGASPPAPLSGAYSFGDGITAPKLQFDFHDVLYLLKSFGVYTYSDFYIDNSLVFNFVKFKGSNLTNKINFHWGGPNNPASNIIDYNLLRLGQRMYNDLYGIATDINGLVLHFDQRDDPSVSTYGLIEGVAAYSDIKDQATLNARLQAEVPLISAPDNTAISITLNEKGYPLGQYDVGDIVSINIQNNSIAFNDMRRIVGITVTLDDTGREVTTVQTNKVLPWQYASLGS